MLLRATLGNVATAASPLFGDRNRRLLLVVALIAAAAAAAVVGVTLLQTHGQTTTRPGAVTKPHAGRPPLEFEFGVDTSPETRTLAQAQSLYDRGQIAKAGDLFAQYRSPAALIGSAFVAWPTGHGVERLQQLAKSHPSSALVALHLGWAYYWAGRNADAATAWQRTARLGADSPYGVDAEDALHGGPPGLPAIVTGLDLPKSVANLPAAEQIAALKRAAAKPDARAKLLYGVTLWNYLRRPISAERELAAAARLAPHDAVIHVAAAVALFSKAKPTPAFAHLGPLTAVFPNSAAVEFHLGELLVYIGEYRKAATHLHAALADAPRSPYAKPARTLLASLVHTRSK
jgi:tetratricopeptide (TPR) repeat protein